VSAVLAAAARAVLEAVLVLAAVTSVFWAAAWPLAGPQDWRVMAWLAVMCVTITGAGLGVHALHPRKRDGDG
jgi:hypothetical protein